MSDYRRPSWHDYFIGLAQLTAARATCPRRRVGAILVRDQRIIATGYNGSVSGDVHCDDVGCLMVDGHCVRTVHAEINAILQCAISGQTTVDATLYSTDFPCVNCAKALVQAQIADIIYLTDYPDENSIKILEKGGIALYRAESEDGEHYRLTGDPVSGERLSAVGDGEVKADQ